MMDHPLFFFCGRMENQFLKHPKKILLILNSFHDKIKLLIWDKKGYGMLLLGTIKLTHSFRNGNGFYFQS